MNSHRSIVEALQRAAERNESVVLCTVVRVVGSSYGGVGARMVARVDGTTVGLVSGGCLESDLAEHARRVHESGCATLVSYDTRADDDAVWGLGLGCNGLIDVLLEPLGPARAADVASTLAAALDADALTVLATVVRAADDARVGAQRALDPRDARHAEALAAGRRGLFVDEGDETLALETIVPTTRLLVCGSGPDALPVVRFATQLGWSVTVVDHRADVASDRFPGAHVVSCPEPSRVPEVVSVRPRTAAVVMSHHFARDTAYVGALLAAGAGYVGVLGPRTRTERMLAELATRGEVPNASALHGPVGLDLGGDGPEAIALAIIAEVAAVTNGRAGGHLRDRDRTARRSETVTP